MALSRLPRLLQRVLAHRLAPILAAALALLLTLPSLGKGLATDDLVHAAALGGARPAHEGVARLLPPEASPLRRLFVFFEPQTVPRLREIGLVPWWAASSLKIAFFRPLSALTHALDHRLWPARPALMHLHSLLWFAALALAAALLYRRLHRAEPRARDAPWVAGLAGLLYAVDELHFGPVSWLANRNAIIAALFGALCLLAHHRWRADGWRPGAILAPLCLGLSLLAAEAGVAILGYLAAFALVLDGGRRLGRLLSLVPALAVVVAWRLLYRGLGFGVGGTELYVDPLAAPARFGAALVERGPLLLLGQLGLPDPAVSTLLSPAAGRGLWLVALIFVLLVGLLLVPLLRRDRLARFFGLGLLLALIPACAPGLPAGRLLTLASLGGMGLVARFVAGLLRREPWVPRRRLLRVPLWGLCGVLLLVHGLLAPLQLLQYSRGPHAVNPLTARFTAVGSAGREAVVVNAPSALLLAYLPFYQRQPPARLRVLAPGYEALQLERVDRRSVIVRPARGYFATAGLAPGDPAAHEVYVHQRGDRCFLDPARVWRAGQRVEVAGMVARVERLTGDGRPAAVRFTFSRPLEDRELAWLRWDWERRRYLPLTLPAVGGKVRVPGAL